MNSMGVRAALVVLATIVATVKAGEGGAEFWGKEFTLTCPENGLFYFNGNNVTKKQRTENTYTDEYDSTKKGPYYCEYEENSSKTKYYFYVQGNVCESCFELDAEFFAVAIVADFVLTAAVMWTVYSCTKKKSPARQTHTSNPPARPAGRGPPVPSPDYEQLSAHTRSKDTYSTVNRTG